MLGKKKIMLVEDNEVNAKMVRDFLQFKGYEVITISNGLEVLPSALKEKPNLILMDIQLFGISGIEAIKLLKQNDETKKTPIFIMSAFSKESVSGQLPVGQYEEYIEKPIIFSDFIKLVNQYLDT
jgi:two-component system, cell cycle response regulator DivK